MAVKQRITEARVARVAELLTPRDKAVLQTLETTRVATGAQLRRLHFTSGTSQANARQAQRRLRALTEYRLMTLLERRVGGLSGGSSQAVYGLDVTGQRLMSACGPAGGGRIRRPWTPGQLFLTHAVAVTELLVRLTEAARSGAGELLTFDAEPACWRRFTGPGGARLWLKPDAFVRFAAGDYEYAHFVEVDRATAAVPTIARKLDLYRRYWQAGREQERHGVFPKVLVLVPSERRKAALVAAAARLAAEAWPLFQIARYDEAVPVLTGGRP